MFVQLQSPAEAVDQEHGEGEAFAGGLFMRPQELTAPGLRPLRSARVRCDACSHNSRIENKTPHPRYWLSFVFWFVAHGMMIMEDMNIRQYKIF